MIREIKKEEIAELIQKVDELGRYLTNHPEVSGEEKESCEYITQFLKKEGYEITAPYGEMPYSFRAVDKEKKQFHGKKAVFLCEYDALPEVGHACGHSYSCAISILGALLLKKFYPDLPMRIDLVGTPGEEFVGGKCYMTENGAFDEYEYAAMIHLYNRDSTYFEILASNDRYFTFHGKAAHASAFPEEGVNALNAARLYMEAMDMWRQHITKDCQFHGIVVKGGEAPNIVPEEVCLDYYYRAATLENLWKLNKISENCARGAALATGTEVEWQQRYPDYGEIYWNEYTPPTIPFSFFSETEIGKTLSLYQKETGNKVIIKDCSLGKGIPAIGLIIINEAEQLYNFKLGVDFIPTVALERCFTEIHQGRNSFEGLPFKFIKTKCIDVVEKKLAERNLMKIFINGTGFWPMSVLQGEESYMFKGFNHLLGESNSYLI